MYKRAVLGSLVLFMFLFLLPPALAGSSGLPTEPGHLYNRNVTVDRYLGARNLSDNPPSIPNSNPSGASPRFLVPGGYPIPKGSHSPSSRGSARGRSQGWWFPIGEPLGVETRARWPLGLQPFDRRTQRSLAKVIDSLD